MDIAGSGLPHHGQQASDIYNTGKLAAGLTVRKSAMLQQPVRIPQTEEAILRKAKEERKRRLKEAMQNHPDIGMAKVIMFQEHDGTYIIRTTDDTTKQITYYRESDIMQFYCTDHSYLQLEA